MSFSFKGIDHIQLVAPKGCEEEARKFYGEQLGLKEIPKPENLQKRGGCWFICGNQEIHIGVQEGFLPAKKAHPGFIVDNLEALRSSLQEQKITIKEEPPIEEGRERFFVDDPFGNRIEFLEFLP
ncbi:glyoxalase [Cytobacillus firmus]|nr:VOC family protein [Cytobacillus firmus]MBG9544789.1 glyoxalase [Cytobacillus firmus]MBG9551325.1 glyoxalase [Cytobacillus firmus]MBG9555963.1 glyoxalase [Cytobacillus firmus]MBG9574878.1 glyoxalase [Cytobacillus firmus]MEC1895579.1 VOC family protein [Cytobacillus firmus]